MDRILQWLEADVLNLNDAYDEVQELPEFQRRSAKERERVLKGLNMAATLCLQVKMVLEKDA